ncbi:MAG TPA: hypothetical protein VFO34_04360 [Candidatus Acidoferrales bacterium]|nr:hypothetical protein [Candidatus Acidoferrales bacterium]
MAAAVAPVGSVPRNSILSSVKLLARILLAPALLFAAVPCAAHVGSPDVYFEGAAGPYRLSASVRTPQMIPGIADLQISSATPGIRTIRVQPLYIAGEGSKYPPEPEALTQSKDDANFFTGQIWMMGSGSWQVRVLVEGDQGKGEISIPVPAFARRTLDMQRNLGILLFALMILLVAALVTIISAGAREGTLPAGETAGPRQKRTGRIAAIVSFALVIAALIGGRMWWTSSAAARASAMIYERPALNVTFDGHDSLRLQIGKTKWHSNRPEIVSTALIPDHGHLMHLFLLRAPAMDAFYHLHPASEKDGAFSATLPDIRAGHYRIFADIVRSSGFPDTLIAEMDLPEVKGAPLAGDDSAANTVVGGATGATTTEASLSDGTKMIWETGSQPLTANRLLQFSFRVQDAAGKPATGIETYMGMPLHAEIVRDDFSVFAHVHPEGSISMAALMLANQGLGTNATMQAMPDMPGMNSQQRVEESQLSFPYGFPQAGDYRIFVQIKRSGRVETGVFGAHVLP